MRGKYEREQFFEWKRVSLALKFAINSVRGAVPCILQISVGQSSSVQV